MQVFDAYGNYNYRQLDSYKVEKMVLSENQQETFTVSSSDSSVIPR